jgi:hypothetical protein
MLPKTGVCLLFELKKVTSSSDMVGAMGESIHWAWLRYGRRRLPPPPRPGGAIQQAFRIACLSVAHACGAAVQYQAMCQLVLANMLSVLRPVVVLTDLAKNWTILWLSGDKVYARKFATSAAIATVTALINQVLYVRVCRPCWAG